MKPSPRQQQGIALVITLVTLVIATILIVAFVTSMRTERKAASSMANDERAKLIAQSAVQQAMALLDKNIPQPVPPGLTGTAQNWIINPGLLTVYSGADGTSGTYVPLFTSTNSGTSVPTGDIINLNSKLLTVSDYPIIPTGDAVPVNWLYIVQDPTSPASASNPIIGRYAYWMDDENNKININTAYGKPASLSGTESGGMNTFMERSNPLDQSGSNGNTWFGATTYNPDVGFNSLTGTAASIVGTDLNIYQVYADNYPGETTYPASGTVANAVGNVKITGTYPGPRFYPIWHPSAVNLDILPTSLTNSAAIGATDMNPAGALNRMSLADWVFNGTTVTNAQWRLLQGPDQIKQFITTGTSAAQSFYQANKFNLTAYNRAPEFNVFGKPRLLMEAHINSMEDITVPNRNTADSGKGNLSGAELEFCQTPDLDPFGPTHFHGLENSSVPNGNPTFYYSDLTSVQMVGDYLSTLLNRSDWPGMPATSFVSKWGGGTIGALEADQVAWNIVAMGNYASNLEGENNSGNVLSWPDDQVNVFKRNTGVSTQDSAGNSSPYKSLLSSQLSNSANADPNLSLRLGKLSGMAVMPYTPRPYLNEAALVVTAIPANSGTATPNPALDGVFYLNLSLQLELYVPRRGPPGTFWPNNNVLTFNLTHFFYTVTGMNNGQVVSGTQGATGGTGNGDGGVSDGYGATFKDLNAANSNGSAGPWIAYMGGAFPDPPVPDTSDTVYLPVDSYPVLTTTTAVTGTAANTYGKAGSFIWVCSGTTMQAVKGQIPNGTIAPMSIPPQALQFSGTAPITVQAKARIFLCSHDPGRTYEIVPVWDKVDTNLKALAPPSGQQDSISWNFQLDLSSLPSTGGVFMRSLEIADARLGGNTNDTNGNVLWQPVKAASNSTLNADSLGVENSASLNTSASLVAYGSSLDLDSYGYFDFQGGGSNGGFYKNSPRPSIGFLDCVPTGMQRGIVNSTLTFGPSGSKSQLPDWLLLDIVAPTFADTSQPTFAPYSYLHSTMGKININASLYPALTGTAGGATTRLLPLEALFENAVPNAALPGLAGNVANHTLSGSGQDFGAQGQYDYIGEICEVAGVADGANTPGGTSGTKWQKEALIRNLANLITTRSNTFHLWGDAQTIKVLKASGNTNYGIYQSGDTVTVLGEKRFESVIERSVWPGIDGVPGNGHLTSGTYDQISTDTTWPFPVSLPWAGVALSGAQVATAILPGATASWAQFDGPDNPNTPRSGNSSNGILYTPSPGWYQPLQWTSTPLQNAQNPARVFMTYKPVLFRYITE